MRLDPLERDLLMTTSESLMVDKETLVEDILLEILQHKKVRKAFGWERISDRQLMCSRVFIEHAARFTEVGRELSERE